MILEKRALCKFQDYYVSGDGSCVLILGDCYKVMGEALDNLPKFLLTDPPYGINFHADGVSTKKNIATKTSAKIIGDSQPFDPTPFVSFQDCLLWGANNFCQKLPAGGQWYFWDKVIQNGLKVRISEAEYCWHKRGTKPRGFRHLWSGNYRGSENGTKYHPSQKPVALMKWCLQLMGNPKAVFDPFAGSCPVGVACKRLGIGYVGVEVDPVHYQTAKERLIKSHKRGRFGL